MNLHNAFPYPLYLVLSEEACLHHPYLQVAEQAIKGGVDVIQLREKNCTTEQFKTKANQLKEITTKYDIPLIINDNLDVAVHIDAEGIHVGNSDVPPSKISEIWPNKMIGYSIEYLRQFDLQEVDFAHHLGISPVFSTSTKKDTVVEWGISGVQQIRTLTEKPLIGIGNMNLSTITDVLNAGANSIAVVSAICHSKDPYKEALLLKSKILNENL
jgi:thiamine-phosphate pyrophosphorylase